MRRRARRTRFAAISSVSCCSLRPPRSPTPATCVMHGRASGEQGVRHEGSAMKCPKCGYLGFEQVDRCRNCGYEFSLAAQQTAELSLKAPEIQIAPIEDLGFLRPTDRRTPTESTPADLPLFGEPISDDEPLIKRPSAPRQPLAV